MLYQLYLFIYYVFPFRGHQGRRQQDHGTHYAMCSAGHLQGQGGGRHCDAFPPPADECKVWRHQCHCGLASDEACKLLCLHLSHSFIHSSLASTCLILSFIHIFIPSLFIRYFVFSLFLPFLHFSLFIFMYFPLFIPSFLVLEAFFSFFCQSFTSCPLKTILRLFQFFSPCPFYSFLVLEAFFLFFLLFLHFLCL